MDVKAGPEHEILYRAIVALFTKHPDMPADQILAIAANALGKIIAMQDQRKYTPEMIMEIVIKNIEVGNAQMQAQLMDHKGSA